ncbi:F-box protein SKIP22-like [Gossypium arboreum]|uniref:F-box domain-containing protein n=1 Tax=Gossypium arboreum TaxID=29729 RepID=A0ABR0MBG0_GOSAR|nr:F-box protein SKIP22-like [Gossypium arboreum]KAK5770518.1 hypothetical protein PVK06_046668 [Gossypium arboreum]
MKLRLRNHESRETLRIQLLSPCSFLQLQETLSLSLPPPHPPPSSLRFSLNANDLLLPPSPHASLHSLGVAAGDLLYFSSNPTAFSAVSVTQMDDPNQVPDNNKNQETQMQELPQFEEPKSKDPEISPETMDIDASALSERLSEPYFLRKVLGEELGDSGCIHKLLAISVHAVLLESGFVGIDPISGLRTDRFHLPDEFPFPVSFHYSLPELLRSNLTDDVVLKFQTLGHFFQVYGSLFKGSSLYKLSLDETRFAPTLNLVWENCDKNVAMNDKKDGSFVSYPESEVFEFWKIVKDGLALPLLIDLCDKTGLALPVCLIRLPAELKVKILELLPGADIAKMECVCSEMRYLASNNDLWKQKFKEEFGCTSGTVAMGNWKKMFISCWESRKKRNRAITRWQGFARVDNRPLYFPIWRDPNPFFPSFGVPHVIGGEHDASPFVAPHPYMPCVHQHPFRGRQNFRHRCNHGDRQNDA